MADDSNTTTTPETASRKRGRGPSTRPRSPRVHVVIDPETITGAVRRDSRHCMIAEAIKRAMPELTSVSVDVASIRFTEPKRRVRFTYMTPPIAQHALVDFDQGQQPEPFSFTLNRPAHITRNRPVHDSTLTKEQRQKLDADRQKASRAAMNIIRAPNDTEPFKPPRDYAKKIVAALEDPAMPPLGPAVCLQPPHGSEDAVPIIVGGKAPPRRVNLKNTRMFGLRELRR